MYLSRLLFLALALFVTRLPAQQAGTGSLQDGGLVDCGPEKVALIADTRSKDGRFALAWTIRPNRNKTPVDWSAYNRDTPSAMFDKFRTRVDEGDKEEDYLLVDGVVDLTARTFTPLPSKSPYFPGKNHFSMYAVWSDERRGTRYALAANEARFNTANLWLIEIGPGGIHVSDLCPAADHAVGEYMRKRDPRDHDRYVNTYEVVKGDVEGRPTNTVFGRDAVTIPFTASIPKEADGDTGRITFALPGGNVTRTVPVGKK